VAEVTPRDKPVVGTGRTAFVVADGPGTVLKCFRDGFTADDEWMRTSEVAAAGSVAMARPITKVEDGLVFERIEGASMLDALSRRPWELFRHARALAALEAQVHSVTVHAVKVSGLPSTREQLASAIGRAGLDEMTTRRVLGALDTMPDGDRLAHGDLHPGNVLLAARGPVLIDWADATRGEPLADAARTWLLLTVSAIPDGAPLRWLVVGARARFAAEWRKAYSAAHPHDPVLLERWFTIVAAARLAEDIDAERRELLDIVDKGLAAAS
jgi:aminoglycoside phosphotransferase (APT) family kinase protein